MVNLREHYHNIFEIICSSANRYSRLIALFLVDYSVVETCLMNNENNIVGFMKAVLMKWYEQTEPTNFTWQRLGSLLLFLGLDDIFNNIEEKYSLQNIDKSTFQAKPYAKTENGDTTMDDIEGETGKVM